jgi:hypothetical protein
VSRRLPHRRKTAAPPSNRRIPPLLLLWIFDFPSTGPTASDLPLCRSPVRSRVVRPSGEGRLMRRTQAEIPSPSTVTPSLRSLLPLQELAAGGGPRHTCHAGVRGPPRRASSSPWPPSAATSPSCPPSVLPPASASLCPAPLASLRRRTPWLAPPDAGRRVLLKSVRGKEKGRKESCEDDKVAPHVIEIWCRLFLQLSLSCRLLLCHADERPRQDHFRGVQHKMATLHHTRCGGGCS